ncbi:hypothetical protein C8C76_1637 [Halanaerobium saccharolyticum]|jgi:hypothetical protein|uniref:Uncharacterized protein n=1 Tax=Halanaerobium saccharolyticum TaxID=43595 RepID=A0A2T5RF74_9FIRM|nr:hypothetical protein [Halanaerobium saccharolyticum]PTV92900.1 hypothetical protein C8C76_1637 [Halanaerobium saccharolyticum]PUU88692.1 MAG: hypothetical protein CI948_2225 [Halanaerobium sp.]
MSGANKMYKNKIHLTDIDSCRRYLSRVINQLDAGAIDGQAARDRGYIIKIIAELIKDGELSERVEELEKMLEIEGAA